VEYGRVEAESKSRNESPPNLVYAKGLRVDAQGKRKVREVWTDDPRRIAI
jgi:hypothetical protein